MAQAPAPVTQPRIGKPAARKIGSAIASTSTSMFFSTRTDVGVASGGVPADVGVSEGIRAWVVKTSCSERARDAYPRRGNRERGLLRGPRLPPRHGQSARHD